MSKVQGRCLCQQVSYHCDSDPISTIICHCQHCQKSSGAAYSVNIAVLQENFHIQGDSLVCYTDKGEKDDVLRYFCQTCGSPIYTEAKVSPGLIVVKAGTLDDNSWVKPDLALWKEHRQAWVELQDIRQAKGNLFAHAGFTRFMVKCLSLLQRKNKKKKNRE